MVIPQQRHQMRQILQAQQGSREGCRIAVALAALYAPYGCPALIGIPSYQNGVKLDNADNYYFVPVVDSKSALRGCLAKPGLLLRDVETGKYGYDCSTGR